MPASKAAPPNPVSQKKMTNTDSRVQNPQKPERKEHRHSPNQQMLDPVIIAGGVKTRGKGDQAWRCSQQLTRTRGSTQQSTWILCTHTHVSRQAAQRSECRNHCLERRVPNALNPESLKLNPGLHQVQSLLMTQFNKNPRQSVSWQEIASLCSVLLSKKPDCRGQLPGSFIIRHS